MVWAKSLTVGELGFHHTHIPACVSLRRQMTKDYGEEVTHEFGGKCLPEVDLSSTSLFIFLTITLS